MAVRTRSAFGLFVLAVICLFSYCGFIFFEAVVSLCVLYVCSKSLYSLFMYNFASDEALFKYEQRLQLKSGVLSGDIFLIRFKNIFLYTLFIIYFWGAITFAPNRTLKVVSMVLIALWTFDLVKTVWGYFVKPKDDVFRISDAVFEIVMWIQNILSEIFAVIILMTV